MRRVNNGRMVRPGVFAALLRAGSLTALAREQGVTRR